MDKIDKDRFVEIVLAEFPQLGEEFVENEDLLHLQMAAFSHLAKNAIDTNETETLLKCYEIAGKILEKADSDVENAIYVSFLEHLEFDNSAYRVKAKKLLPPILRKASEELEEHFKKLAESYNARIAK